MGLRVRCQCGNTYDLNETYAGHLVRCPRCQSVSRADRPAYTPSSQADPAFDRDVFLFAPEPRRIHGPHPVSDESGGAIALVERPESRLRSLVALAGGCGAMFLLLGLILRFAATLDTSAGRTAFLVVGALPALLIPRVAASLLVPKRQVVLHRPNGKRERLLEILQDRALQLAAATYIVRDGSGEPIARLRTSPLLNALRRRWEVCTLAGHVAFVATEESLVAALRRRILSRVYRPQRTTIAFYAAEGRRVLAEFKETPATGDRYVLDLRRDRHRKLDRRVALALGVMLDGGEGRRA